MRAKQSLDRIAFITRPRATVIRDGHEQAIDPVEIVQDDLVVLHTSDHVLVDGPLIGKSHVEVDESLLTGESDSITQQQALGIV